MRSSCHDVDAIIIDVYLNTSVTSKTPALPQRERSNSPTHEPTTILLPTTHLIHTFKSNTMRAFAIFLTLLPLTLASPLTERAPTCGVCDPNPNNNVCNPTTSCSLVGGHTYCACRAGYRATTGANPGDSSVQWRLNAPYQDGRVFVAPGVTCDTLCDHWELGAGGCQEVSLRSDC